MLYSYMDKEKSMKLKIENNRKKNIIIVLGIVLGIFLFFFLYASGVIKYGKTIEKYADTDVYSAFSNRELTIDEKDVLKQDIIGDNGELNSFSLKYHPDQFIDGLVMEIFLCDASSNEVLQCWIEDGENIAQDGFREYVVENSKKSTDSYYIEVHSNQKTNAIFCTEDDSLKGGNFYVNDELQEGDLVIRLTQTKYVINTLIWGIVLSFFGAFFLVLCLYCKVWLYLWKRGKMVWEHIKNNLREYAINFIVFCLIGVFGICIEVFFSNFNIFQYNTIGAFNEYRYAFIVVVVLCIFCAIRFRTYFGKEPEKIFLILFFIIGMLYVLVMPAEAEISWDESIHYWRAVSVSNALSGQANVAESWLYWHSGTGFTLPNSIEYLRIVQNNVQEMYNTGMAVSANTDFLGTMGAVAYIPSAIGLIIGRGLRLPYSWIFQLGAAMNMILYLVLIYCSMKRLKSGKMILVIISSMATPLFLASVYSSDSWIVGFTSLGAAYFLGCMQEEKKVSNKDLIIMVGAFSLAFMPKAIYCVLFLVFLLIPSEKFCNTRQCMLFRVTTVALCITFIFEMVLSFKWFILLFMLSWIGIYFCIILLKRLTKKQKIVVLVVFVGVIILCALLCIYYILPMLLGGGDLRGGAEVNSAEQVRFIIENPIRYAKILLRYLKNNYLAFQGGLQVPFRTFGYIGESTNHVITFVLLWIVSFTDKREDDQWKQYNKVKITSFAIIAIVIVLVATALYISFTPVSYETINGCQPRYLLPMMFLFFALIGTNKVRNEMSVKIYNSGIILIMSAISLLNVWQVVIQFYS